MKPVKKIKNLKMSKALKVRHRARIQEKINNEADFIYCKKYKNSLAEMLKKHPDGIPDNIISKILRLKPNQLSIIFSKILTKLREGLKIQD